MPLDLSLAALRPKGRTSPVNHVVITFILYAKYQGEGMAIFVRHQTSPQLTVMGMNLKRYIQSRKMWYDMNKICLREHAICFLLRCIFLLARRCFYTMMSSYMRCDWHCAEMHDWPLITADGLQLTCNVHFAHAVMIKYMQEKVYHILNLPNTGHLYWYVLFYAWFYNLIGDSL